MLFNQHEATKNAFILENRKKRKKKKKNATQNCLFELCDVPVLWPRESDFVLGTQCAGVQ